jgi:meiotically up-regulated gene 157 (Mug157) protein
MRRNTFLQHAGLLTGSLLFHKSLSAQASAFETKRPPLSQRNFTSTAIEDVIAQFKLKVKDQELSWLFENCFPNTLDTTVFYAERDGAPDTYVITGDIDAMWLRDSSAQVWPYLSFIKNDTKLKLLISGVINRQTYFILQDPYANAFYKDTSKVSRWASDRTDMKPGIHERKWEIDSLCYPIRLAYRYWKETGDTKPFNPNWKESIKLILKTFKEQQRKTDHGPYHFQRPTEGAIGTLPMKGYGFPVKPNGLICSMFRPSDDATIFPFLVPSNFFAVVSLSQAAEMVDAIFKDHALSSELQGLAAEVKQALRQHAIVQHPTFGKIYAFEVDGFGNHNLMDDANLPSLLSLPYLNALPVNDAVYQNTRRFALSVSNPYFYKGRVAEGIGGPHVGRDNMIWPLGIIARGLTSTNDTEIRHCITMLKTTHADTGFIHETFNQDDPADFTRKWFAWGNTIFGEFLWKTLMTKPHLLNI